MTREDARRKVKALLAMAAAGSGATDAERETARALAEKLMKEHGFKLAPKKPEPPPVEIYVGGFGTAFTATSFGQPVDLEKDMLNAKISIFRTILGGVDPL